jgi:formamidopyrimidine-DNA glycosylase
MPELPEVEIIARRLQAGQNGIALPGHTFVRASLQWPRQVGMPSAEGFRRRIRGRAVQHVRRRGKYIVLDLDRGALLFHLRMSGDLYLRPHEAPVEPHEHTRLILENGWELRFRDVRKFGRIYLVDDPQILLARLGPEPLDPDFRPPDLARLLAKRHGALKPALMDQTLLAGLGNIYTDEALHRARLHPRRLCSSLNEEEIQRLWRAIRAALRAGLRHNGASIDAAYRGGGFQKHFRVYRRTGLPCPSCGTPIQRIVLSQRSTHFCPACQPEDA